MVCLFGQLRQGWHGESRPRAPPTPTPFVAGHAPMRSDWHNSGSFAKPVGCVLALSWWGHTRSTGPGPSPFQTSPDHGTGWGKPSCARLSQRPSLVRIGVVADGDVQLISGAVQSAPRERRARTMFRASFFIRPPCLALSSAQRQGRKKKNVVDFLAPESPGRALASWLWLAMLSRGALDDGSCLSVTAPRVCRKARV
jgi:hypothetical protein